MKLLDKNGREIHDNDVIKVFHFEGARRKKHYMYKLVRRTQDGTLWGMHLSKLNPGESRGYSLLFYADKGGRISDTEVVQSSKGWYSK